MPHTPGPWSVGSYPPLGIQVEAFAEDGNRILYIRLSSDNMDEDSTLIAAAPNLLEALRAILFQVIQGPVLERDACIRQAIIVYEKATSNI